MPKQSKGAEERSKDAWRRRKSSVLLFPDEHQDAESKSGIKAMDTRKGDSESGGGRVFRGVAKPKQKSQRSGLAQTKQGTVLPDGSVSTCGRVQLAMYFICNDIEHDFLWIELFPQATQCHRRC